MIYISVTRNGITYVARNDRDQILIVKVLSLH